MINQVKKLASATAQYSRGALFVMHRLVSLGIRTGKRLSSSGDGTEG
jgi:hypothetical protein